MLSKEDQHTIEQLGWDKTGYRLVERLDGSWYPASGLYAQAEEVAAISKSSTRSVDDLAIVEVHAAERVVRVFTEHVESQSERMQRLELTVDRLQDTLAELVADEVSKPHRHQGGGGASNGRRQP